MLIITSEITLSPLNIPKQHPSLNKKPRRDAIAAGSSRKVKLPLVLDNPCLHTDYFKGMELLSAVGWIEVIAETHANLRLRQSNPSLSLILTASVFIRGFAYFISTEKQHLRYAFVSVNFGG